MAATTPNLGLTLPVGNEKVSRQIINGNNSIIDTAFGSAGAKLLDIQLNDVTNVSGSYTGTTYDERVTATMKALEIELGDPSVFRANITVSCGAGYITLSCSDVVGTSTVKVSILKLVTDPTQVTSTEFDILNNRIGILSNLATTDKTSAVAAINEVKGNIPSVINNLTSDSTTSALSAAQGKALNNKINATQITGSTKSAVESSLETFGSAMSNGEIRRIWFGITTASEPFVGTTYVGTIERQENRFIVVVNGISTVGQDLEGFYKSGTGWAWQSLNNNKAPYVNTSPTFTLDSGINNLEIVSNATRIRSNIYVVSITLKIVNSAMTSGERKIGSVDILPATNIAGAIVDNNNTKNVGGFMVITNGDVYINLDESVTTNHQLRLCSVGLY